MRRTSKNCRGFTLIELLVVLTIIGILSAIAVPSYTSYLRKQELRAAQSSLASMILAMENRYLQNFSYPAATTDTATTLTALPGWAPAESKFTYIILASDSTARTYTLQASGSGTVAGCTLAITQANVRTGPGCLGYSTWSQ